MSQLEASFGIGACNDVSVVKPSRLASALNAPYGFRLGALEILEYLHGALIAPEVPVRPPHEAIFCAPEPELLALWPLSIMSIFYEPTAPRFTES
jgi:hypothetical protein